MNVVRSLLQKSHVPIVFWPEAVCWSVYVLNRSPFCVVHNMTPEEAWSGQQPDVQHIRVFGCIAFSHVPDQKKTNLDDKVNKCVFIGVHRESKSYKL